MGHLVNEGAFRVRDGVGSLVRGVDDLELPRDLLDLLGTRAQSVSPRCRVLLVFAATFGDEFVPEELGALMQLPEPDLVELLEEAGRAQLLVWDGEVFRFRHPLLRQALYRMPGPLPRQRIHLEIAERLERIGATTGVSRPIACNVTTPAGSSRLPCYADATQWRSEDRRRLELAKRCFDDGLGLHDPLPVHVQGKDTPRV